MLQRLPQQEHRQQQQGDGQSVERIGLIHVPDRIDNLEGLAHGETLGDAIHHLAVVAVIRPQGQKVDSQGQHEQAEGELGRPGQRAKGGQSRR